MGRIRVAASQCGRIALLLFLASVVLRSQNPPQAPQIRVATHLVQIGVIVRDANGPVANLTKGDFAIFDRGKRQEISIFSVESSDSEAGPRQPLTPNTFSNLPQYSTDTPRSVTVVLLDNLNTLYGSAPQPYETKPFWVEDQALANAKAHLVQFITQLDPRDRVAIYGLSKSLHVLCDFTSDRSQLLAILKRYDTTPMTSREEVEPGAMHTPGPGAEFDAHLNADNAEIAGAANGDRAATTMAALQSIAGHVSNIPGRKNLVWLTSNLPFSGAAMARVLGAAEIAVYPVDGRGLLTRSSQETMEGVMDGDAAARGNFALAQTPQPIGIATMEELADDTGGQASVNTNDLTGAIRRAVENSKATYTLGFYIDDRSADGKFHPLKVQINRSGLNVRYPKGYFALKNSAAEESELRSRFVAAIRSPIESSAISLVIKVNHVEQPETHSLEILGSVGLSDLQLAEKGGTRSGTLVAYVIEQDAAGNILDRLSNRMRLKLTDAQYQTYLQSGIGFRQYVQPKPAAVLLRVIVQDPATSKVGSVILPLAQVK